MLVGVTIVALVGAVLARRLPPVQRSMPPPASTLVVWLASGASAWLLAGAATGFGRALLAVGLAVMLAVAGLTLLGLFVTRAGRPMLRWLAEVAPDKTPTEMAIDWADGLSIRVGSINPVALTVRSLARAGEVRIPGLAAEMSYYALISLAPIATALGASLGFLRPLLGDAQVEQVRQGIVDALTTIFAEQVAADVLAPLVDGLLSEGRAGLAVGALALTLYLASRVFSAVVRAINDAYRVPERPHILTQFALGVVFTLGAVLTAVSITMLVVVGPLLGDGAQLAERFGVNDAVQLAWDWLRWPTAVGLVLAFLTLLYRYAPHVRTTWRECLPGGVLATLGVLVVSAGFGLYVDVATPAALQPAAGAAAVVRAAAQMFSLVVAGVLWLWLVSMCVLLGGILNAELDERPVREPQRVRGS